MVIKKKRGVWSLNFFFSRHKGAWQQVADVEKQKMKIKTTVCPR